jgi:hypothetical protein
MDYIKSMDKEIDMTQLTINQIERAYPARAFGSYYSVRAYWVPIELRETVLKLYKDVGMKIRLRYRGSRAQSVGRLMPRYPASAGFYKRTRNQANQDCLLADATHFTIYNRD